MRSILVLLALMGSFFSFTASAGTTWGYAYGYDSQGNYVYCYGYTMNGTHYCTATVNGLLQDQRPASGCYESSDCGGGYSCVNGSCERDGSGFGCHSNMDCQVGERCYGGTCG